MKMGTDPAQHACQAETTQGPCRYVSVRVIVGVVPDCGYPLGHQLAIFGPGETVSTYACTVHQTDMEHALRRYGLHDVHVEGLPGEQWAQDGSTI